MDNVSDVISKMYLDIINNPVTHNSVRKNFPRECVNEIFYILESTGDVLSEREIDVEVKLRDGLVSVRFTYFPRTNEISQFEKKIREKFSIGD